MTEVKAQNVKVGMGLKTWFGTHTVVRIDPYEGPFKDFSLNILVFSNGTRMTNVKNHIYKVMS